MKLNVNVETNRVSLEGLTWSELGQIESGLTRYIRYYHESIKYLEEHNADPGIIADFEESLIQAIRLLDDMTP